MTVNNSHFLFFGAKFRPASILFMVLSCCIFARGNVAAGEKIELHLGQGVYQIELARTAEQRRLGLMYREQLNPRQGMLLVYPAMGDHRIWMKNVRIDLRVYWINDVYEVIDVQHLKPCRSSPCPVYSAPEAARYVLELGNYDHQLAIGDTVAGLAKL